MDVQAAVAAQVAAGVAAAAAHAHPGVQVPQLPPHQPAPLGGPALPLQPQVQPPPVPPQGQAPVPPAAPSSYQERFLDGRLDTLRGDYAELNHQFRMDQNNLSEEECQAQALLTTNHDCYVGFLLAVSPAQGHTSVRLLLNPKTYHDPPGTAATAFDGVTYAQVGDLEKPLHGGFMLNVAVFPDPAVAFDSVVVMVPTLASMAARFAALQGRHDSFQQFVAGTPDTEMVDFRKMIPVGAAIAALLVGGEKTPQEFWTDVVGHIRATASLATTNDDIINWGRALLCDDGYGGTELSLDEPTIVRARGRLLQSRIDLVLRDCPGAAPTSAAPPQDAVAIVTAIREDGREARAEAQRAREDAKAPKTVEKAFHHILPWLLKIAEVYSAADLPPFWTAMAATPKKDQLPIAQQMLDAIVRADPVFGGSGPVLAPHVLRRLLTLALKGDNVDDLDAGVNPFHASFSNLETAANMRALQDRFSLMQSGDFVNYADVVDLERLIADKIDVPINFRGFQHTLLGLQAIFILVLGYGHRVVRQLKSANEFIRLSEMKVTQKFERNATWPLMATRAVQLELHDFWWRSESALNSASVEVPDLSYLVTQIHRGNTGWIPDLPMRYAPIGAPSFHGPSGGVGFQPQPAAAPAPAPSPVPTPSPIDEKPSQVSNKRINPLYAEKAGVGWTTKKARKDYEAVWPKCDDGVTLMCLSYQCRGRCLSTCGRRLDHKQHSDAESSRFCTFLDDNFSEFRGN